MPEPIRRAWETLLERIGDYPDPESLELKHALVKVAPVNMENLLIGNGAAELIFLLANVFQGKNVLIVDPTFSEYRTAAQVFGCRVDSFRLKEENGWKLDMDALTAALSGKDVLFICNPNNPTGVLYEKETLLSLIKNAVRQHVIVVVDEAFSDFCVRQETLLPYIRHYPNLVILRSFTKMFAIPGVRLGWLAAKREMVAKLKKYKPHWSVNAIAEQIGIRCLAESDFVDKTRTWIDLERKRVMERLKELDFVISDSSVNYYILREAKKTDLKPLLRFLIERGIVARHTENFIGLDGCYLRFAVRTRDDNDKLIDALESWRKRC